jgi:hypothetical protein
MPAALASPAFFAAAAAPATQPISVQTALLIILGIILLLAAKSLASLHRRVDALSAAAQPKQAKAAPASEATDGSPPPEIIAVITAAVVETLGSEHRIVSINADTQDNPSWSHEGRRQIFNSRKVR